MIEPDENTIDDRLFSANLTGRIDNRPMVAQVFRGGGEKAQDYLFSAIEVHRLHQFFSTEEPDFLVTHSPVASLANVEIVRQTPESFTLTWRDELGDVQPFSARYILPAERDLAPSGLADGISVAAPTWEQLCEVEPRLQVFEDAAATAGVEGEMDFDSWFDIVSATLVFHQTVGPEAQALECRTSIALDAVTNHLRDVFEKGSNETPDLEKMNKLNQRTTSR